MQQLSQHFLYRYHFLHPVKFQQQRKKKKQDYFTSDIPQFAFLWDLRRQFNPSQLKMYSLFKISEFINGLSSFISYSTAQEQNFPCQSGAHEKFICSSDDGVRR